MVIEWLKEVLKDKPTKLLECERCKRDFPSAKMFCGFAHQLCQECREEIKALGIVSYKDLPQVSEFCYYCGELLVFCEDDGWWRCPKCQADFLQASKLQEE